MLLIALMVIPSLSNMMVMSKFSTSFRLIRLIADPSSRFEGVRKDLQLSIIVQCLMALPIVWSYLLVVWSHSVEDSRSVAMMLSAEGSDLPCSVLV